LIEKDLWIRISAERKVKIIGIARHVDKQELKDWVENSEISFPVLYDKDSKITNMFNIKKTPMKILINNSGKVLLADESRSNRFEQKEFIKMLYNATAIQK
jgi:peroxiredoxin